MCYIFEHSGNITGETLNSGLTKSFVYDGRNRLASEMQSQNSANTLSISKISVPLDLSLDKFIKKNTQDTFCILRVFCYSRNLI